MVNGQTRSQICVEIAQEIELYQDEKYELQNGDHNTEQNRKRTTDDAYEIVAVRRAQNREHEHDYVEYDHVDERHERAHKVQKSDHLNEEIILEFYFLLLLVVK